MRTLVDTSVWIDHLSKGNAQLAEMLRQDKVVCHPMVIGELACGGIRSRKQVLSLLHALPMLSRVGDDDILLLIESKRLYGRGLGLIDAHLLASCLHDGTSLWTKDRSLAAVAKELL